MVTVPLLLASIFLNGVNIDGLKGQTFEKCKAVRIDDRGDVHLDCPGYQVEQPAAAAPAPAPAAPMAAASVVPGAALTKHYWLVTEQSSGADAQYDIDVFVNSKWVRKVKAGEPQIILEITKYLGPGANKVLFAATKQLQEKTRRSASPSVYVKAMVGEGEAGGQNVVIDNLLVEVKRTAAELDNRNEEYTVNAR